MSLNGRLGNSEIGGCKEIPFANPSPTLCQPFANPSPTFRQPFANLFCQTLSNPLFPWTPGTRLETLVNGFLVTVGTKTIADPENCFQELISEKSLIFLRDGPCLELIIVSSNFQALLLLQDKLLESV